MFVKNKVNMDLSEVDFQGQAKQTCLNTKNKCSYKSTKNVPNKINTDRRKQIQNVGIHVLGCRDANFICC